MSIELQASLAGKMLTTGTLHNSEGIVGAAQCVARHSQNECGLA